MSWGNPESREERLLRSAVTPFSLAFGAGIFLRSQAYAVNALKQSKLTVPVISIGNITVGGTGKTPMTIEFGRTILESGLKLGILSRGYRRTSKGSTVIVSDGKGVFAKVEDSGDEALLIARSLPEAVVIVGAHRKVTGTKAIADFGCQILLLDDGMQHLPLYRDADVVLLDYNDEPANDALLPAGRLREPLSALARASSIVITKIPANYDQAKLDRLKHVAAEYAPTAQVNCCRVVANSLVSTSGEHLPLGAIAGKKVAAFSGLASPEGFLRTLEGCGAVVGSEIRFPDHHWYSEHDVAVLEELAARADFVLTTEKDLIKLTPSHALAEKLHALSVKVEWIDSPPALLSKFIGNIKSQSGAPK